ncbi:protein TolQ [Tsuneonella troitsensis]|jgi:biopolymer transport protein TolQ|uniref:protein TolQ n=1 Tax=Tsuneonella troitsensis TaxID=292222 RepID=UPI000709926F|nr:protein TolQ [Tsuneonella troitsensis]
MTDLLFLAAATPELPGRLDPLRLFLDADIVVQAVMLGLLLASVWVWMIIVGFSMRIAAVRRRCREYETDFWEADSFETLMKERGKKDIASARVAAAAMREWRASVKGGRVADRDGLRQRLAGAMHGQIATEADELSNRLNFLATVGSVAPFVGLFGTVWGIMNSFFQIGQQQNSSLAVVAPGISEALFATAIGLFAAIPAVIAYNRFGHAVNSVESRLHRFADRFHASLSREIETL